jgi:hypothetical protein
MNVTFITWIFILITPWGAFFSKEDDRDEKATRLYTVIGRLDRYAPEIKTRISNGGTFLEIAPAEVFEHLDVSFPEERQGWFSCIRQNHFYHHS